MQLSNDTGIWRAEQTSHEANSKGVVPGRIHVQRFTILEHLSEVFGGNGVISPSNFPVLLVSYVVSLATKLVAKELSLHATLRETRANAR